MSINEIRSRNGTGRQTILDCLNIFCFEFPVAQCCHKLPTFVVKNFILEIFVQLFFAENISAKFGGGNLQKQLFSVINFVTEDRDFAVSN